MRRIAVILLAVITAFSFSSCSVSETEEVISINDGAATVSSDVFSYYLKAAMIENKDMTDSEYLDTATNECIKYVAVNTKFKQLNMTLTPAQKADVSKQTNTLWRQYGGYYSALDITKETFYKIKTAEEYREAIRFRLFDTGGETPVSEDSIKAVFNSEYCGFRFVCDYLYDTDENGETVKKSQSETDEIYNNYLAAASEINNSGANLEEAYAKFASDEAYNSLSLDTVLIGRDSGFPDGFFDTVQKAEYNKAVVIITDDYLYLLIREDILSADYDFYTQYRDRCLVEATESPLSDAVAQWAKEYNAVRQINTAEKCYKKVLRTDKKFQKNN